MDRADAAAGDAEGEGGPWRAVSPVIGVVLMLAVTVVLAATVAGVVFGLGDRVNTTAPQVEFSGKYTSSPLGSSDDWGHSYGSDFDGDGEAESGSLELVVSSGSDIAADRLSVRYPGGRNETAGPGAPFAAGASVGTGDNLTLAVAPGDTVEVVWTADDGSRSTTLSETEVPLSRVR